VRVLLLLLVTVVACTLLQSTDCLSFNGASWHKFASKAQLVSNAAEYETHYYTQILDHFSFRPEGYQTFQQKYLVNAKHWGGPQSHSPIFVCMGDEIPIETVFHSSGFMMENAPHFRALLVYIEHRYYGSSMPFGSPEESFKNASTLGYFNSQQALADFATVILDLKKNMSAENSPVIVVGGSYGGMLAAWFRLKYPHIAIGALSSSAPILYFDDITPHDAYATVVTRDFRSVSESCYNTIRESWTEIDKVASQPGGLEILSKTFNACQPFNTDWLVGRLISTYRMAAQYGGVKGLCKAIDGLPKGSDNLARIAAGVTLSHNKSLCFDFQQYGPNSSKLGWDSKGWSWQTCTEIVIPLSPYPNGTIFAPHVFDLKNYSEKCKSLYGVLPRANWITTEFGGHNIRRVLKRFASNIIFSNGLQDPYSSGGVLQSISESIIALTTDEGIHCQDMHYSSNQDPESIREQRSKEVEIITKWIKQYEDDLNS